MEEPVALRRISKPQDAGECRILFISSIEEKHLKEILTALDESGVLTVSDMPGFTRRGGMIQFVLEGDRVRFEINLASAESARLVLSSELLKVAASVKRNVGRGIDPHVHAHKQFDLPQAHVDEHARQWRSPLAGMRGVYHYDMLTFRATMVRNLSTQAQIIGSNSVSALLFNDSQSAENTLSALKAAHNILSAGDLFQGWQALLLRTRAIRAVVHLGNSPLPYGQLEIHWFKNKEVVLVRSIVFEGKPTGTVCHPIGFGRVG